MYLVKICIVCIYTMNDILQINVYSSNQNMLVFILPSLFPKSSCLVAFKQTGSVQKPAICIIL